MTHRSVHAAEHFKLRSAALYLLMAFIGGQAQSLYAVQAFVRRARRCYRCVSMPTWHRRMPPCLILQKCTDRDAEESASRALQPHTSKTRSGHCSSSILRQTQALRMCHLARS